MALLVLNCLLSPCLLSFKGILGGYSTVNCLYNSATNGLLKDKKVSQMTFFDAISLYSSILSISHPFCDFMMLDSTNHPSLFAYYAEKIMNYDSSFFVDQKKVNNHLFFATVRVTYSPQMAKWGCLDLSAFPTCRTVESSEISGLQREWFKASGKKVPTNTRLVSSCRPNTISQHIELLFFECLFLGCSITRVERIVRSRGHPVFKTYIDDLNRQRQSEESSVHGRIIKALSNTLCG